MNPALSAILACFLSVLLPLVAVTASLLRIWKREGILSPVGMRLVGGHVFVGLLVGGMTSSMVVAARPVSATETVLGVADILAATFIVGAWTVFLILSELNKNDNSA